MKRMEITNSYTKTTGRKRGVVLIIVLVILLSTLGYTITARVSAEKHRDNHIVDYCKAQYACDSAAKYALATIEDINNPQPIGRANAPDFSDLFALSERQYQDFLEQWAKEMSKEEFRNKVKQSGSEFKPDISDINDVNDANEVTDVNSAAGSSQVIDYNDPNQLDVPGPYGPKWPLITKPVEFEIGETRVKITMEDENAKYPLGWVLLEQDRKGQSIEREADASFMTFCEWMDVNEVESAQLKEQLEKIGEIKNFSMQFKPVKIKDSTAKERQEESPSQSSQPQGMNAADEESNKKRSAREALRRLMERRKREKERSEKERKGGKESEEGRVTDDMHLADFCRIFNSPLLDSEVLTRPTVISENRTESAMKYLGMWATRKVNVNTAPRHILEAAFNFGGDYVQIADRIIMERRIKPFQNTEDLKQRLFQYSDSIEKCEDFITTESNIFTIRIKANRGTATARAIIAVRKDKGRIEKIAALSE